MLAVCLLVAVANAPATPGFSVVIDVTGVRAEPGGQPASSEAESADAAGTAAKLFATRCALCHGNGGRGDGPSAAGLTPRPRRLTDAVWQGTVSDDDIAAVILRGGGARKLSTLMPANVDLKDKPDVVAALVAVVRGLRSATGGARATLTSAGRPALVASSDASPGGAARIELPNVGAGEWQLLVESAPGGPLCRGSVVVKDADVRIACAPATPPVPGSLSAPSPAVFPGVLK